MIPELELEPESHSYIWQGVRIPSCSEILSQVSKGFGFLSKDDLTFYQDRGHMVHKAIELTIRGDMDKRSKGARDSLPYLESWNYFVSDYGFEPFEDDEGPFCERQLVHPSYRYGVTPDVVGMVKKRLAVVEIKSTSAHSPLTGLQTAAQALAVRLYLPKPCLKLEDRYAVRLIPGKHPEVKQYKAPSDEGVFLSLLNVLSWKIANKITLKEIRCPQ